MELTLVGPRPRTVKRAIGVAAALVAAALAACNGTDRAATPGSEQSAAGRSSPRLDKAVTAYTSREFQTVVSGLYFGGSEVDTVAVADTGVVDTGVAGPAAPGAVLVIEAMSTANEVSLTNLGPHGTVIARLRNLRGNDNRFGTKPGAAFEYYVVARQDADSLVFQLAELTRSMNPQGSPREASKGTIRKCQDNEPAPPYSYADFGTCPHENPTTAAKGTSFLGVKTLWALTRGSGWVSCLEGCCELTVTTINPS